MTQPAITTIIPTYNRSSLLRRAVQSVQSQNYDNLKICIYDNASGDETERVVSELMMEDPRVAYLKRDSNIGPVENMIDASMRVSTPLYSLLNDDDFLLPGFYSEAVASLERFPAAGIVWAPIVVIDVEKMKWALLNSEWKPGFYEPSVDQAAKMYTSHLSLPGMLMRKEVKDTIGALEPSGDDVLHQAFAAATVPFVVLETVGAVFTAHRNSFTSRNGLRSKQTDSQLFENLALSSERILQSEMPAVSKGYLLLLISTAYGNSMRQRNYESFLDGVATNSGRKEELVPSVNWQAAGIHSLLRRLPQFPQQIARKAVGANLAVRRRRSIKKAHSNWSPLSDEISDRLQKGEGVHLEMSRLLEQVL